MCDESYQDGPPRTFPGTGWYEPEIGSCGSISTLPLPEDKADLEALQKADEERQKRGIGFAPPTQEER